MGYHKASLLALIAILLPPVCTAALHRCSRQEHNEARLRLHEYRKSTVGPGAVARSAAGAEVQQLRNHPREWGHGIGGYTKRFASGFGQHAVKNSIQFGVGALRHEDPSANRPLKPKGVFPKLKDAFRNTFTVRRYGHQKHSVAAGCLSGAMGAGMVSRVWQPSRLATAGAGLQSGGITLGADLAINTAHEFIPNRKKHHLARNTARHHHKGEHADECAPAGYGPATWVVFADFTTAPCSITIGSGIH